MVKYYYQTPGIVPGTNAWVECDETEHGTKLKAGIVVMLEDGQQISESEFNHCLTFSCFTPMKVKST